jgi:hypothetical protein
LNLKELIDFRKLVQEISIDYSIRLGACQGKFFDEVLDVAVHGIFFIGNELFTAFSVGSKFFLFTS